MNIYVSHYVYAYLRQNGTPYYIGKGVKRRAWCKNHRVKLPKDPNNIVILENNLTEIGALALERRYIKWYGRKDNHTGILQNMSDGGEGAMNRFVSDHERNLRKFLVSGDKNPQYGKKLSEEHKQKLHHKNKLPKSEQHKKNISEGSKNRLRVVCPFCHKESAVNMAKRWHFDNCKSKTIVEQV